jgi:Na+/H+ antiporter NhaD/arsenite permease-like protein
MVVSAQLRLGGFYGWVALKVGRQQVSPVLLLGTLIFVVAGLAAVFSNDVVCLAIAPVLVDLCLARRLDPIPFLLALACSANVGSALTLIGNPQNMLIGETLRMDFLGYLREAAVPVILGLFVTWTLIAWSARGRWHFHSWEMAEPAGELHPDVRPAFDRWQTAKGLAITASVFALFLFSPLPREVVALTAAGVLMLSRKLHSRKMLGLVDWQILVLFIGLFVVNDALERSGLTGEAIEWLRGAGIHLDRPGALFVGAFVLSNVVSNVPAVMLLLPVANDEPAGVLLALASTLAGNLLVVGSIANLIVVDAARRRNVRIDWKQHAAVGVPVALATLAIAGGWLALRG